MNGKLSNFAQKASLRRYTLADGREKGLEVIDCDNGKIRFLLNVSKALDIMQVYHEGVNVSFLSKNAFTAREVDFLSRFEGGMLYTCGLDSVGGREGFPLHGTFHTIPASVIRAECMETGICVEAVIQDTQLFGKNLVMKRKIYTEIDGDTITLEDTLINVGYKAEEYCLLYHVNVGYPMLDDGAKLFIDAENVMPRTVWAAQNQATMYTMSADKPCEEECCYFIKAKTQTATLVNETLGKTFTLSYSGDTLPHFVEWKSMASGDYALGLEPATTMLDDKFQYAIINANEEVSFALKITIKDS